MGISRQQNLTGIALAWFLLFPSLGIVQKYLGTAMTFVYLGVGFILLAVLSARGLQERFTITDRDRRWFSWTVVGLYAVLVVAFVMLYPLANTQPRPLMFHGALDGGGSDRDESLVVGIRELLAGRYPYYQTTYLNNAVTQLPGSLLLAVPFALMGNAVWQNLFWLAAFCAVTRYLFGRDRVALGFLALIMFASPAVFQDFVTGGDLGVNAIAILIGMLGLVELAPDQSIPRWKKVGIAAFTGVALSSRLNAVVLVPPLFAAMARRANLRDAVIYVFVIGLAFMAVTLPFYWHDPAGFAPLHLHNKFSQFDGEIPNSHLLFPGLSLLISVLVALYPGNRQVGGWLMQSGLVVSIPVVFLVGLASLRSHAPNFVFTGYALAGAFFGGMGAGLSALYSETSPNRDEILDDFADCGTLGHRRTASAASSRT